MADTNFIYSELSDYNSSDEYDDYENGIMVIEEKIKNEDFNPEDEEKYRDDFYELFQDFLHLKEVSNNYYIFNKESITETKYIFIFLKNIVIYLDSEWYTEEFINLLESERKNALQYFLNVNDTVMEYILFLDKMLIKTLSFYYKEYKNVSKVSNLNKL